MLGIMFIFAKLNKVIKEPSVIDDMVFIYHSVDIFLRLYI